MTLAEREQYEIQLCLNCPRPKCVNCLGGPRYGRLWEKHEEQKQRIKEYAHLGMTDRQMAIMLRVSPTTVSKLRNELGIPPLKLKCHGQRTRI